MPHTLFISDLHLSEQRPDITACFVQFCQTEAVNADALYVLGDLFEYWIGDDHVTRLSTQVADSLSAVANSGTPVFFIHGNRDFLIRKEFAKQANMTLLPEQFVIDLYGNKTLIMHGDELCTLDVKYQQFRKKARGWWWPRMILSLPLWVRKRIAENGRKSSKQAQSQMAAEILDVTQQEVEHQMLKHQVQQLIHGHTHRPALHEFTLNDQPAKRIVLGDWYEQGSVLLVTEEQQSLVNRAL